MAAHKLQTKISAHKMHKLRKHKAKHPKVRQRTVLRKLKANNVVKVIAIIAFFFLSAVVVSAGTYLQGLSSELPDTKTAFNDPAFVSRLVSRDGEELYKLVGDFSRDPVHLNEVPEHVKWAFLAAEDIDFYSHQGFDPTAIARCAIYAAEGIGTSVCGGSTITQQLIKMTSLGGEVSVERKMKEILLATRVEAEYGKDKILEQYLTLVPMGSNLYGVTTGADFYFDKKPQDLTLAEATLLAAIIQDPIWLSPTLGLPDPETAKTHALERQAYILNQMENYMNKINAQTRLLKQDPEYDDVITLEMIEAARTEQLNFRPPVFTNKKAGHFVDYAHLLLLQRPYNNGKPFTEAELVSGGYTIYTTLDYQLQQIAEQTVRDAVSQNSSAYNLSNAALLTLQPATGEVLAMVGSRSYYEQSEGCDGNGANCRFNPQVNIMTSPQSPGSSTKPFGYYEAYRQGKFMTGSLLPDIPIDIPGYSLKNWNSTFFGASSRTSAGQMLCESRNLPAVIILESIGIPTFVNLMKEFGYTTYKDPSFYGHSVILGGADVKGVEHAQAYGIFANNGKLVKHELITKIVDKHGNVVFEYKPEQLNVGDARAAYMVNKSLEGCANANFDGRTVAAKTGTSQDNMDNWVVMYSPDFVNVAWMGNNNNESMYGYAFGESTIIPWLKNYMRQVGDMSYFTARSDFSVPEGVSQDSDATGGFGLSASPAPKGVANVTVMVCADQPDRLARPIDIETGNAIEKTFQYYSMPSVPWWQGYLNAYLGNAGVPNGGPTQYCDIERDEDDDDDNGNGNGNGNNPPVVVIP